MLNTSSNILHETMYYCTLSKVSRSLPLKNTKKNNLTLHFIKMLITLSDISHEIFNVKNVFNVSKATIRNYPFNGK